MIQEKGGVPENELYQVFNMGIGMTLIVKATQADSMLRFIKKAGTPAWIIGETVKGTGLSKVV
ncbi:Phosphoribosylformylglycinamidine cyclo-ligase [bioreactor metagenome]|uniref:phosphoribosylformylglycinamidine cyclo-ligase n=1 Tax=bioreactor metagenome TaxID=1076179 RepID=A0A645I5K5_9ZZZZ